MTEIQQVRRRGRTQVWLALSALAVLLALLIAPPFVSIRRYQKRITDVIAASVGRPVRLSSVELRILPRPSFVITDLTIQEDPAYGAEPVLHANTVTASIRLMPLWWHARLEISRISVDEASLNLVRSADKRWNIDSFFRTAAARTQSAAQGGQPMPFPYLEATDSRVNIKNGVEKLPYSLVNADLSFWQDSPGEWRVRLKGQPARTDVSLDLPDTGILRLEGRMRRGPDLRHMPIHFDADWREAQLGQLSRLLLGDDKGWRGNLTGETHVDGTAEAAQITTRLRASGVHRVEFAPASPIDFDATCSLLYHYSDRGLEKLLCESPIGDGRARLTGQLTGHGSEPRLTLEFDRVPAQLALDTLRTVRNGIDPSLQAGGSISGRISYAPENEPGTLQSSPPSRPAARALKNRAVPQGPLAGTINIAGLSINGDSLTRAVFLDKVVIEPAPGLPPALAATLPIPAGASSPLTLSVRLTLDSYQVAIRGSAALPRLRELAKVAGAPDASALQQLDGPPAALDLTANGPWLRPPNPLMQAGNSPLSQPPSPRAPSDGTADQISGTLTLHSATWKPGFLANPVEISNAVLHIDEAGTNWDPVSFSYGPVSGTATLQLPRGCGAGDECPPVFTVDFGDLDASALQAAILGARKPGTLLSGLLTRLRPGTAPGWPQLEGTLRASAFILGPVTLTTPHVSVRIHPDTTEIQALDAGLLGGHIHAEGSIQPGEKPDYKIKGQFDNLNPAELGQLLGMNWSGNPIAGGGELEVVGFTDRDLAASAKGSFHFDWRHGAVAGPVEVEIPAILAKFDRWSAEAEIANGAITLKQNQVQRGAHKSAAEGRAAFGTPPVVTFGPQQDARAADLQSKPH
jgi:hypothetical protein